MAKKRVKVDEQDVEGVAAAKTAATMSAPRAITDDVPKSASLHDHVLSMQRAVGNERTTLVLQRKERAASTDAPWVKKAQKAKKKAVKKAQEKVEDYAPTEANPKFDGWELAHLAERATNEMKNDARNSLYFAEELMLEWYFRTKSRAGGVTLYRIYKKLGDEKRADWWIKVSNGQIKPGQKAQEIEDMSDKQF